MFSLRSALLDPLTLPELLNHHETYARQLAEQHGLGALASRGFEGNPRDAVRTATYRFANGVIRYDATSGVDYHGEKLQTKLAQTGA